MQHSYILPLCLEYSPAPVVACQISAVHFFSGGRARLRTSDCASVALVAMEEDGLRYCSCFISNMEKASIFVLD